MKPAHKIQPKCKACRFFSQNAAVDGLTAEEIKEGEGFCRRHAPHPRKVEHGDLLVEFPRVYDNEWCGEWQRKGGK